MTPHVAGPFPRLRGKAGMGVAGARRVGFQSRVASKCLAAPEMHFPLHYSGSGLPPPQPSPVNGGGGCFLAGEGTTALHAACRFPGQRWRGCFPTGEATPMPHATCPFPRLRGKAGMGVAGARRVGFQSRVASKCLAAPEMHFPLHYSGSGLAPTPTLPRKRGRGLIPDRWNDTDAARNLPLPPFTVEGWDGGGRRTSGRISIPSCQQVSGRTGDAFPTSLQRLRLGLHPNPPP